jgi:hypothetical protein
MIKNDAANPFQFDANTNLVAIQKIKKNINLVINHTAYRFPLCSHISHYLFVVANGYITLSLRCGKRLPLHYGE